MLPLHYACALVTHLCLTFYDPMDCSLPGSCVHSLLQGIFSTEGSSVGLLHCRQILYHLSQQGRPTLALWICLIKKSINQEITIIHNLLSQKSSLWYLLLSFKNGSTCTNKFLQHWNKLHCFFPAFFFQLTLYYRHSPLSLESLPASFLTNSTIIHHFNILIKDARCKVLWSYGYSWITFRRVAPFLPHLSPWLRVNWVPSLEVTKAESDGSKPCLASHITSIFLA